jgi:Predicted permease
MSTERRIALWVGVFVILAGAVYLLRGALLPFIAGMAVAYLLDPLADRFEGWGVPRWLASLLIVGAFIIGFVTILLVLVPTIVDQVTRLIANFPDLVHTLTSEGDRILKRVRGTLTATQQQQVNEALAGYAGQLANWFANLAGKLVSGGAALFNLLSLTLIMPVVAFYLLRDWDEIVARVNSLLPQRGGDAIREVVGEIDQRLSGFVRGQALVCLLLAIWYATGLTLIGLNFGLAIGLAAGILSIIPFLGNIFGLGVSLAIAFTQFDGWTNPVLVIAVFASGNFLEGNFISPKIVGDRVGLHPVWLLFAVMAGGSLLGITGALLAVPVAAAIGVVVRFLIQEYRESPLYVDTGPEPQSATTVAQTAAVTVVSAGEVKVVTDTGSVTEAGGSGKHG